MERNGNMSDTNKMDEYQQFYYDALLKETKYWALGIQFKYLNELRKFLFDDEQSARKVYDDLLEQYKKYRDYRLNADIRIFSFASRGECNNTLDLEEVITFSVQPPAEQLVEAL